MADFDKSIGQCMEQKASNKLNCLDSGLLDLLGFTILVCKGDLPIFKGDQPMIGYGNPMSVSAEIFKHVFGMFNWLLEVNNPLGGIKAMD